MDAVTACDGLLVVGSSLMVYSAFRLAKAAVASGAELALVSVGPTRADDLAHLKVPHWLSQQAGLPWVGDR